MGNIATTIEQSRKLIELGLATESADMTYLLFSDGKYSIKVEIGERPKGESFLPAWSLAALLGVLPLGTELNKMRNDAHEIYYEIDCADATGWVGYEDSDPITAAYEMVCCLLEQGLIKKGGEEND